jgi:hypothetical protein
VFPFGFQPDVIYGHQPAQQITIREHGFTRIRKGGKRPNQNKNNTAQKVEENRMLITARVNVSPFATSARKRTEPINRVKIAASNVPAAYSGSLKNIKVNASLLIHRCSMVRCELGMLLRLSQKQIATMTENEKNRYLEQ